MKIAIDDVLCADCELDELDFKQAFNPNAPGDWLELIKDIVAVSNSGGGYVVIGCLNNGHAVGVQPQLLPALDSAVIDAKVFNYTGVHLESVSTAAHQKDGRTVVVVRIPACEYPMPFIKVGSYAVEGGKGQKTAFNHGNLYFRHSAKSEPAHADDLRKFVDRKISLIKEFWLAGIRQVVEAPADSVVTVVPAEIRLSNSPDAQNVKVTPEIIEKLLKAPMVDQTHPYRQKEVIAEFNKRMSDKFRINPHDLLCVRRAHNIHRDLKYCYNMNWNSPRYSEAFVEWLIQNFKDDSEFFEKARQTAARIKSEIK